MPRRGEAHHWGVSKLSPASVRRVSQASSVGLAYANGGSREGLRCWSGGGPMWIAQDSDIKRLMRLAFPLDNAFMPPGIDGAGTAQARRVPHVDCANHWH